MTDQPADAAPTPDKQQPSAPDGNPSSISEAANPGETMDFRPLGASAKAATPLPAGTLTPTAFGRYAVKKVLGSGAFGMVYLGHDPQLDRSVAIKVHRPDRAAAYDYLASFKQEARRIAKLRHPGIVTVHDFDIQGDEVYIVADYVDGTTLKERLKSQPFTWQESVRIVAELADAIAHAHSHRVIHRDIKPANIILTPQLKPVLVDFGLGLDDSEMRGHQRGMVAGTPAYMSPEQTTGQGHRIDGRTDIYSLGVVLYELITGHVPFRAPSNEELIRQIRDDEPQPPRQLVPHIPRGLEQICLKALAKSINDRFITAGDLAEELTNLLAGVGAGKPAEDDAPSVAMTSEAMRAPTAAFGAAAPAATDSSKSSAKSFATKPREAERRQLTLLSCSSDLFESADFIEKLDYEEQHEALRAYQELCNSAIQRHGGTALQLTEQAVLACFGYPVAYEDAAARAIRAGLDILKDAAGLRERLQRSQGLGFTLSATIHTGMAIASDSPEGAGREAFSIVGEARNVISRLDSVAWPDAVVISQTTYRLVQGYFLCESLGNSVIKGVARPLEFFKVVRESDVQSRIEVASATGLTPLVGRDREVGLLQDRWEQAAEGMGQVVLLIGEAGLGKSRLIHVIKEHVLAQSAGADKPIVEWRCTPHHQNSSLYPVIDFFERFLRFEREDGEEQKYGKLQAQLQHLGLAGDDILPYIASLLSLPNGEHRPELQLAPARLKEKTLDALMECLRVFGIRQPFLFIIEDLHWIDPSTLELLTMHVEGGLNERILTVMTFRPEFETPWKSKAHQTVMALNRLTRRQIGDMMAQKTGVKKLPPALVEQIVAKTDGVPLFVEEYTTMMIESGKLRANEGDLEVAASYLSQEIPATLQDLLMARLDRMASNREVVQVGATIGREFTYELLRAVAAADEQELQAELDKLVSAELLFQKGKPPHSTYQFKHALIQDAAYQSLLKSKKQQVHRRVALALEQQLAEVVQHQPELLAHHFAEAGLAPQAIEYWLKAGLRSQERSANAEAVSHFRRGLDLLAGLPDTPERASQELGMQIPLGTGLIALRGYAAPEVGPIFARARELCVKIGEPRSLMAVLWGIWAWRVVREEFDQCLDLAKEVLTLAKAQADDGMLMEAHFVPGLTLFYRGDFTKAHDHLRAGLALYDDGRCRLWSRHTGQNSGVTLRSYLALSQWCLGFPDQALQTAQDAVKLARAVNHPYSLCYALHHLGWLQQHLRSAAGAQSSAEAELTVAAEHGFTFWKAVGTLCSAAGLLLVHKPAAALDQAKQGLAAFDATGAALSRCHYLSYFADAHGQLAQHAEATRFIDQAIAAALRNHNHFCLAELHRLKGEIFLAQQAADPVGAEACFQDALAIAQKQQAKSWELRINVSLCKLWHSQGQTAEALARLASVYQGFTEGFATPDLVDAKKLLDAWA